MRWKKLKNIFAPENNYSWMVSHAANPFAVRQSENVYRIYFTCRDELSRSHVGYVDVDFSNNFSVVNISNEPILSPGELGLFDDSGVAMGYYIEINNIPHIYYLGWNLKVTVPWLNSIGLAVLNPLSGNFEKLSKAPILDRSNEDPFSISYPSILHENGIYRMWYGSNLNWGTNQEEMNHVVKYAESIDGVNWKRENKIAINLEHVGEYAISKPFIIKDNNFYKMWYSHRSKVLNKTYRIGYAESLDGINWERMDDEVGIDISEFGWDSEMVCYPFILDHEGSRYMIYNGNGYGRTGFGIAKLIENE
jgi:predicted GH43/DUF377 family glycosyl hydrolase